MNNSFIFLLAVFHLTADELNTLHKISQAINKIIENELGTNSK
jgi:hypothetical protein